MLTSAQIQTCVNESDDTREMVQAAIGDIAKFSAIYNKHYTQVYYFVFKRTSDRDKAFDLTSVVFLKAMEHLKNYRYTGIPFEAWLFRIALNEIYALHRKKKIELVYNLGLSSVQNLADEIDSGEKELQISGILDALQKLEKEEMDMIEMRFFSQHTVREIACVLNISENNASVRLFRIIQKLKTIIHHNIQP